MSTLDVRLPFRMARTWFVPRIVSVEVAVMVLSSRNVESNASKTLTVVMESIATGASAR